MTPSSFMSPTKEASADLSPMDPISQARECRNRDPQRLLHESPRRVNEGILPEYATGSGMGEIPK